MSRRRVSPHPRLHRALSPSANGTAGRAEPCETCRVLCPCCGGPMTARCGRAGPYFHCLCHERRVNGEPHPDRGQTTGRQLPAARSFP